MSDERDDLDQLLNSAGWQRLLARAKQEWGPVPYAARLEVAAQSAESGKEVHTLIHSLRAVNAILSWPKERIVDLTKQVEAEHAPPSMSRGGAR